MTETTGKKIVREWDASIVANLTGPQLADLATIIDAALATVTAERDHFDEMLDQANDCDIRAHEELRALDVRLTTVTAEGDAARAEVATLREQYHELLYAVGNAFPGESRHETALRYIRQAEVSCLAATAPKEGAPCR